MTAEKKKVPEGTHEAFGRRGEGFYVWRLH
jgi:hypothetical protein